MALKNLAPDRDDSTPLYHQIAARLRDLIKEGRLDSGHALPSERALSELTGASRVTIRRAIEQLVGEGLLLRRQGSGTYVARIEQHGSDLTGFSDYAEQHGTAAGSIWLIRTLSTPTAEEAAILKIPQTAQVARLGRVRLLDGEPLAIENAVVPAGLLPPVEKIGDSLYAALSATGNRPVSGTQRLRASLATSVEAGFLSMPENGEILRIDRRTYRADGTPVEYTRSAYRGDRYDFVTDLNDCGDAGLPGRARG